MTKLYYRGMMADNGKPKIGRHARCLGIRPNIDIDVDRVPKEWIDESGYLQPSSNHDADLEMVEVAVRNTKGMSVSLSIDAHQIFANRQHLGALDAIRCGRSIAIKLQGI
jgi:hypothetical protein